MPASTKFTLGQKAVVNGASILNVRSTPGGIDIGDLSPGDIVTIEDGPIVAALDGLSYTWWKHTRGGWSIESRLDPYIAPAPVPEPAPMPLPQPAETIVYSNDWAEGQEAISGHDNIRVPVGFTVSYLDGTTLPDLPGADPTTNYLAPESTMRSGDTAKYPFTERLPDNEIGLYLAEDSPIVDHWFKRYGKQWWKLGKKLELPPGRYRFSVEVYPDIYSGNHEWASDPLSGEMRAWIFGAADDGWSIDNFGKWVVLSKVSDHPGGTFFHGVEFRARWGIETVGLFIRRWKIVELSPTVMPPPPPAPTGPTREELSLWKQKAKEIYDGLAKYA